ncbi:MAG: TIGR03668 family PPOX class F420-dependent oxidoreductase [Thermomicrobiales bacterium]
MRELTDWERVFVQERRVARLSTVSADGRPSVTPICFAVIDEGGEPVVVTALDEKPKSVAVERLARVRNIQANPNASLVVDDYNEDWSMLAFVQLHGRAGLISPGESGHYEAITALRSKYAQYAHMAIDQNPIICISELSASSWRSGHEQGGLFSRPSELTSVIQGRRSVRAFQSTPVDRRIVEQAIAAAGWAPSPHGSQPWRFAVVESPAKRSALADAMAETWQMQLEMDGQDEAIVQIRLAKSRERLETAPILVIPCLYLADLEAYPEPERQAAERTMAIQSFGAAVQNLLLHLYSSGIDAGWMCAPLFCPEVVRDALGLAEELIPHALIPIGYAAKDPVRRDRRALDELIVSWA